MELIEKLRDLTSSSRSAIAVIRTAHQKKQNRIHSLQKKKYELRDRYQKAIKSLNSEIRRTRESSQFEPSKP